MVGKTLFTKCRHKDIRLPPQRNVGVTPKQLEETCAACTWKIFEDARGAILLEYFDERIPVRTEHVKLLRSKTAAGIVGKPSKDLNEKIGKLVVRLDRMAKQCDSNIKESRKVNFENRWGSSTSEGTDIMARRSKDSEVDQDVIRGFQEENNAPLRALMISSATP